MNLKHIKFIVSQFDVSSSNMSIDTITQGYINDTYIVKINTTPKYILQRINTEVFKNVEQLHTNIALVLKKLNAENYKSLQLYKTKQHNYYYNDEGDCWRLLSYIPNSIAYNFTSNNEIAFETGRIIGCFHKLLKEESIEEYKDTLPNLNYLPFHLESFNSALETSDTTRKLIANSEIEFVLENIQPFLNFYKEDIPLRICHNDTKLNNILFSKSKNKAFCLIDLDTIMKGYFHYDFGDAVRTAVSESNEDETELSNIKFNLTLFENFIKGLTSYDVFLSKKEIKLLPIACALMPFMHGLRALTDYLNGNIYYKVSYENQNLDRCKSLFEFSTLALENKKHITEIIKKYFN